MKNLPNSMSSAELYGWRKWAQREAVRRNPTQQGSIVPDNLVQGPWESVPPPGQRSPYQTCSSCRRHRNQ